MFQMLRFSFANYNPILFQLIHTGDHFIDYTCSMFLIYVFSFQLVTLYFSFRGLQRNLPVILSLIVIFLCVSDAVRYSFLKRLSDCFSGLQQDHKQSFHLFIFF